MSQKVPKWRQVRLNRLLVVGMGLVLLVELGVPAGRAQEPTTRNEFWPEVNVFINLKPKLRLFLLGTVSKAVEDGELFNAKAFESQFGVHVDYLPNKHFVLRSGYRYGRSLQDDSYREHRFITEQTLRKMLPGDLLLSDRNREDFRFLKGDFSFRYRNRVTIEREFQLKQHTLTPYVAGEMFYDTRYDIWNRNRLTAGVQTSLRKGPILKLLVPKRQIVLDLYYTHQNDSRSSPSHVNGFGAVLAFYF